MFEDDWFLLSDFADFFLGAQVGEGQSRVVYEFRLNPKWIVKIDKSGQFNNVSEWDVWHNIKLVDPEAAKFLAPCIHLSSCGRIMIQERTKPIKKEQLPDLVPEFLTDLKIQNWGLIGKRPVCHDFANHKIYSSASTELVKASWWSDCFQVL